MRRPFFLLSSTRENRFLLRVDASIAAFYRVRALNTVTGLASDWGGSGCKSVF